MEHFKIFIPDVDQETNNNSLNFSSDFKNTNQNYHTYDQTTKEQISTEKCENTTEILNIIKSIENLNSTMKELAFIVNEQVQITKNFVIFNIREKQLKTLKVMFMLLKKKLIAHTKNLLIFNPFIIKVIEKE